MKRVIVSGYFNPLHGGHLDMIEAAGQLGDYLIVIVNNDDQQRIKKGKIILDQNNRARLMNALRPVHEVVIAIDNDSSVIETLKKIADIYADDELIFANGGDRDSDIVTPETAVCNELGVIMAYGVGGIKKTDSSTRINQELGHQK
ncbi:adenylyltransferase/cytidyltransferase family protein [Candidatus Saccharibacteria bacterium]|nr:adenylyltransferase/cytidyltransferase family protein [Candidatus Saccharibacteria bacterium]